MDLVCQPQIDSRTAIDFSAHRSSSEVQDPSGLTGDSSGQVITASGAENYLHVSPFEDLNMEQDALVSISDETSSQNEPPGNPKPLFAESLDPGIHYHSTDLCLHNLAQLKAPSFTSEVLESSEKESSMKNHGLINAVVKKSEMKSVLLRHPSPDLMVSRSRLVSQSCPSVIPEKCPPPLITILSTNGRRTIAKEDEWSLSGAASVLTLIKIPSLSEIMPGSSKGLCLGKALYPFDNERTNPCWKGKPLKVRASQSSLRNGTLACVRIKSFPYSHRTLVTPVLLPLDSYKTSFSAMGFLSPWTNSDVSGPKCPKNGLSKLLYIETQSNHSMSNLLNHLDAVACRLIPNRSSVQNVLPVMRYHRTAPKLKHHHHKDRSFSKWPPLNTSRVLQVDICGPVVRQDNSSLYSKQSGDVTLRSPPLHLLSMARTFQTPESIVREGRFSGADLSGVMAMSCPPSSRLCSRHIQPPFSFTSSSFSLVETVKNQIRARTSCSPRQPLADYTSPPGLENDHRSVIQLMLVITHHTVVFSPLFCMLPHKLNKRTKVCAPLTIIIRTSVLSSTMVYEDFRGLHS